MPFKISCSVRRPHTITPTAEVQTINNKKKRAAFLEKQKKMDTAIFSSSSLFADDDNSSVDEETTETRQSYVERKHEFPGIALNIREYSFHHLNANLLWPGTFAFAEWLSQHRFCLGGRKILELGSGTGALAIFLRKSFQLDITTSDYDDMEIEENIAHNCGANGILPVLPHIKHSWGDPFPTVDPDWDLVIASDILLYVKQYKNLIKTLSFLLKSYKPNSEATSLMRNEQNSGTMPIDSAPFGEHLELPHPAFLMSWKRRIGKEDESIFFTGCEEAGLDVRHLGSRVYCINPRRTTCHNKP